MGFPGGSAVKNLPAIQETGFNPWCEKIPWRRAWQPTPVLLPRESHEQRSLAGCSPWGCKELDVTERLKHLPTYPVFIAAILGAVCGSWD